MSDTSAIPQSRAAEIKAQAASWLARVHSGEWTEIDKMNFDAWIAQSRAHKAAYWRLEAAWHEAESLRVLRSPIPRPQAAGGKGNYAPAKIAVAAALAALVGAAGYFQSQSPQARTYATGIGGRQTLSLSDGSKIELNTNTRLRIVGEVRQRQVWLEQGEAFFQIHHDAAHPFTVTAGDHKITDLGTKFSVRQDGHRLRVTLVEGKARLISSTSGRASIGRTFTGRCCHRHR